MAAPARIITRHPPPVTIFPTLRCRPLLVQGIPVARDIRDFARVIPVARFHEKPPLFMLRLHSDSSSPANDTHEARACRPGRRVASMRWFAIAFLVLLDVCDPSPFSPELECLPESKLTPDRIAEVNNLIP